MQPELTAAGAEHGTLTCDIDALNALLHRFDGGAKEP